MYRGKRISGARAYVVGLLCELTCIKLLLRSRAKIICWRSAMIGGEVDIVAETKDDVIRIIEVRSRIGDRERSIGRLKINRLVKCARMLLCNRFYNKTISVDVMFVDREMNIEWIKSITSMDYLE